MRLFSIHYADKCPGVDVSIANTNTNLAAQQRACGVSPPAEFGVVSAKTAFSLVKDKTFVYDCPMNTKQLIEVVLAPGVFAYVNDAPAILPVSRGFLRYVIGTEGVKLAPKLGLTVNSKEVNTEMLNRIPDGGFGCFAGHSTVEVLNKGSVPMKELSIGIMVKVKGGKYSEVYSFGHKPSDVKASFLAIDAGLKKPLVLSADHMVFVKRKAVPAASIMVGDHLTLSGGRMAAVKEIKVVSSTGVFAPFTMDGTIVVDSVVASSYVNLKQDLSSALVLGGIIPLDIHVLAHLSQAPHRLVCKMGPEICNAETYNNGISTWVEGQLMFSLWILKQNQLFMTLLFLSAFSFVLVAALVELIISNSACRVVFLTAIGGIISMKAFKIKKFV